MHVSQDHELKYVLAGKGVESEEGDGASRRDAFAVRLGADGSREWTYKSNAQGAGLSDLANAVLQLPNGGDILVAGAQQENGEYRRSLTRLSLATGSAAWTATSFGDAAGTNGAWENLELTSDGQSVLLAGLKGKPDTVEFNFKSYGNAEGGTGVVMQFPVAALTGSTVPTSADAEWTADFADYHTVKAIKPLAGGQSAALLWYGYGDTSKSAAMARLSANGATLVWGPVNYGLGFGEATELAVSADDQTLYMTGHGYGESCVANGCSGGVDGKLYGRIGKVAIPPPLAIHLLFTLSPTPTRNTQVDASTGTWAWTRSYDAGGEKWIKNECFGVQALADGNVVISCGTGVEDCSGMTGELATNCTSGVGLHVDPRPGAYDRPVSVWQSETIKTDAEGALLYQLVVQGREDGAPALGQDGWEPSSTGSEYVIATADGGLAFVQDEASGIGLMKLAAPTAATGGEPPPPSLPPTPPCGPSTLTADAAAAETCIHVDTYACGLQIGDTIAIGTDTGLTVSSLSCSSRRRTSAQRRLQDEGLPLSFSPALSSAYSAGQAVVHTPQGGADKDPHLHFASGGRADFRGHNGTLYNFFSAPDLSLNILTEDATFTLHGGRLLVNGSFITEAYVVARVGDCPSQSPASKCAGARRKLFHLSFLSGELNDQNTGFGFLHGHCGGNHFTGGLGFRKQCEDLTARANFSSVTVGVRGWTFVIRGSEFRTAARPPRSDAGPVRTFAHTLSSCLVLFATQTTSTTASLARRTGSMSASRQRAPLSPRLSRMASSGSPSLQTRRATERSTATLPLAT